MKTTFKKITAISLAALIVAFGSCITSFAAESKDETDEKENGGYIYAELVEEIENSDWNYEDSTYADFGEWVSYGDCIFCSFDCLAGK